MVCRLVVASAVLGACAGAGPQQIGAQPSWRSSEPAASTPEPTGHGASPIRFAPATAAAASYNAPVEPLVVDPLASAVIAAVHDAAGRLGVPAPAADPRLSRACAELAEIAPAQGVVGYRLVEFAIQRQGIIEPSPHLVVMWGPIGTPSLIVEQLAPQLDDILRDGAHARLGIGAARRNPDGTGVVVFALQASGVTTAPIPRTVPVSGAVTVDAVVDPRYHDAKLLVTHSDGSTEHAALTTAGSRRPGGFTARVACGGRVGRQQLEIAASDAAGGAVLANFPVWCGTPPPSSITVDPEHDDPPAANPDDAEHRLFANLNRDRAAAGLPALIWDPASADVARRYAEEMHRTHIVAHVSPTSGSVADRVRAANIHTAAVHENLARAYGVNEAHDGLMNSPGHRANLMSTTATHVGIGVVFGDEISGRRELFVVQVFIRIPPPIEPARAIEIVRGKVAAARPGCVVNPLLAEVAQHVAAALAAGQPSQRALAMIPQQLARAEGRYQRVGSVLQPISDLDALDAAALVAGVDGREVGIGVVQGPHPEIGERAFWVVLLLANP